MVVATEAWVVVAGVVAAEEWVFWQWRGGVDLIVLV